MDPRLRLFVRLFRGRSDAYGSWSGGCVRERLTPEHFRNHLLSPDPKDWIGVYNVIGTECSWGCIDIDVPDLETILKVRAYLSMSEIPAWAERTTRGYHLWVFPATKMVDASVMRRALTAACHAVGYTPKEVFPKQERTTADGLGNYVRLPLNGALAPTRCAETRVLLDNPSLLDIDAHRARPEDLRRLAQRIPRPQVVDISVDFEAGLEYEEIARSLGSKVHRVWRDGPQFGHDRSSTLARLAHRCADAGADPETTLGIINSADQRWGKRFSDRGEGGVDILRKLVMNAFPGRRRA